MKAINSDENSELEESLKELGVRTGSSLPVVEDDGSVDDILDDHPVDIVTQTKFTSPVANMLSRYYTNNELINIDKNINDETALALHRSMLNISTGAYSSIPRLCLGRTCKSAHACPFVAAKLETNFMGKKCPVEIMLVDEWREQYNALMKENNVDGNNIVVRNYVSELIECDVVSMRMNHYLAGDPGQGGGEIVDNVFVINPKTGDPETTLAQNVAFTVKAYVSNRKEKAMQALMASPYWKRKMSADTGENGLAQGNQLLARAKEMQKKRAAESNIQDATFSVINDGDEPVF